MLSSKLPSRILDLFLAVTLLAYAILIFTTNQAIDPATLSGADTALVTERFSRLQMTQTFAGAAAVVYLAGQIILRFYWVFRPAKTGFLALGAWFLLRIGLMLLCTVPFALADQAYWQYYLSPVWSIGWSLFFLMIIIGAVLFIRPKNDPAAHPPRPPHQNLTRRR